MRLLITGGAGYIGSFITKKFSTLNNINSITCVDNLFFKQEFKNKSKKIKNIVNDVRDKNKMIELYKSHDIIIPLAALVGAPICKKYPKETEEINFKVVDHMCKNLSASQIVIMPVSNSGYGIGEKDKFCDEKSPLNSGQADSHIRSVMKNEFGEPNYLPYLDVRCFLSPQSG